MPTPSSWPRTYLNWKRVLLLSLNCIYFMLLVKFSQKTLEMAANSRLVERQRRNIQEELPRRGEALT
ncbi:uncharacterized protein LOC108111517 [Drosophila eugracilis]|uniref:uncharacterized protein LOC108111517 n=1 Tax=Drosophila eugracilis TaxID=29029 RepID=UPI001BDA85CB|nr:uncharacterized protein LOC108111517 [Drosophila eugracilis]